MSNLVDLMLLQFHAETNPGLNKVTHNSSKTDMNILDNIKSKGAIVRIAEDENYNDCGSVIACATFLPNHALRESFVTFNLPELTGLRGLMLAISPTPGLRFN